MQVGGLAMHWGGVTPRFSPEDFKHKSLYGVGTDWPISYDDLDPFYQEAEEVMGVAGEQGPRETGSAQRSRFRCRALPLTYNLELLKEWASKAGIAMWSQPSAKNSVAYGGRAAVLPQRHLLARSVPIGAKYSPDFTWNALRETNKVRVVPRTLVRKLVLDPTRKKDHARHRRRSRPAGGSGRVSRARRSSSPAGYTWSAHLLLLSAQSGRRERAGESLGARRQVSRRPSQRAARTSICRCGCIPGSTSSTVS